MLGDISKINFIPVHRNQAYQKYKVPTSAGTFIKKKKSEPKEENPNFATQ